MKERCKEGGRRPGKGKERKGPLEAGLQRRESWNGRNRTEGKRNRQTADKDGQTENGMTEIGG